MQFWRELATQPAADFPNHLNDAPGPVRLPRRTALLIGLVLLCLAPRAWMANQWTALCPDAVTYLDEAKAIDQGQFDSYLRQFGPNIYPWILVALHRAGMDWQVAGEWWSVLIASLAVLPLFGWIRRQFDDQVATIACILYALHPKLTTTSPLIIRDATFWFLMNLTIYLVWRSVVEVRCRMFVAAGAALALAIYTRSEGWLLPVPLLLWTAFRLPAVAGRRIRLLVGLTLCLAMVPGYVGLMKVTLLRTQDHVAMVRPSDVKKAKTWTKPAEKSRVQVYIPETKAIGESLGTQARKIGVRLVKAYSYLYGVLVLVGLFGWRRVFFRRDQLALALVPLLLWAAIWLRYAHGSGINIRYFFPGLMVGMPYVALGLLKISAGLASYFGRRRAFGPSRRAALTAALLVAVFLIGMPDRSLRYRTICFDRAELGRWVRDRYGPNPKLLGCIEKMRLERYFSGGRVVGLTTPKRYVGKGLLSHIRARRPDVVLLWNGWDPSYDVNIWADLVRQNPQLGYDCVPKDQLPKCWQEADVDLLVLEARGVGNSPEDSGTATASRTNGPTYQPARAEK